MLSLGSSASQRLNGRLSGREEREGDTGGECREIRMSQARPEFLSSQLELQDADHKQRMVVWWDGMLDVCMWFRYGAFTCVGGMAGMMCDVICNERTDQFVPISRVEHIQRAVPYEVEARIGREVRMRERVVEESTNPYLQ